MREHTGKRQRAQLVCIAWPASKGGGGASQATCTGSCIGTSPRRLEPSYPGNDLRTREGGGRAETKFTLINSYAMQQATMQASHHAQLMQTCAVGKVNCSDSASAK